MLQLHRRAPQLISVGAILLAVTSKCASTAQQLSEGSTCGGVFLATFNIQNFGKTKASRTAVLRALSETIARYDVVAIQELSQKPSGSGVCGANTMSAICDLKSEVETVSSRAFQVAASPRIGDEQYVLMYDSAKASVVRGAEYPDASSIHSRPPYAFKVSLQGKTMAIGVTHTSPSQATSEIQNFPHVLKWMEGELDADFNFLVGDYNADGSYFDEDSFSSVMAKAPGYSLLSGNQLDSTVAGSSNSYDRIIASSTLSGSAKVFVIDRHIDLDPVLQQGCPSGYISDAVCDASPTDWAKVAAELSDHYPVELCLPLDQLGVTAIAGMSCRVSMSAAFSLVGAIALHCFAEFLFP